MSFERVKQVNIPDPVEIIKAKNHKESKKRTLTDQVCQELLQKSISKLSSKSSKKKFTKFMTKKLKNGKNNAKIIVNGRNIPEAKYFQLHFNSQNIFGLTEWENQGWKVAITPCAVFSRSPNSCEFCPQCTSNYLFFDLDFFTSYNYFISFIVKIFHSPDDVFLGNNYCYLTPNPQPHKNLGCQRVKGCQSNKTDILNLYCGHSVCQSHYVQYKKGCKICKTIVLYNNEGVKIIIKNKK